MLWSLNIILIGLEVITLDMNHKKKEEISHQIKNHVTYQLSFDVDRKPLNSHQIISFRQIFQKMWPACPSWCPAHQHPEMENILKMFQEKMWKKA